MAIKKAKPTAKKAPEKKAAPKKASPAKTKAKVAAAPKEAKVTNSELATLDRKTLAGRARKLKIELLAIRFNVQAPSLKEYRKKRRELATVLSHLN